MVIKKIVTFIFLPLVLVAFLHSQSLTELAKKEKERRAAFKGKAPAVITNADLARVKKRPAVEVVDPTKAAGETAAEGEAAVPENVEGQEAQAAENPPATEQTEAVEGEEAAGQEQAAAEQAPPEPQPTMSERDFKIRLAEVKGKVDAAQEMVDLYTLKMNGLWQEFYSLDDMKSRELIQLQISETGDKLTKAQMDLTKAQKELEDFQANARREGIPSIWIR